MEINTIKCMDTFDFNATLDKGCIDLIIADVPYYGIINEKWDNQWIDEDDYLMWIENNILDWKWLLKPTGSLYLYCSQEMNAPIDLLLRKHFNIKNRIIWYRSGGVATKNKFKISHEHLFYCVKDIKNHTWNGDDIRVKSKYADSDKRLNPNGKIPNDVWEIPNLVGKKKEAVGHPSQKPLAICDRIIKASSNENDLVYMPFGGSGSEIISCIQNNRNWIATEISEKYVNLCKNRIENIDIFNKRDV